MGDSAAIAAFCFLPLVVLGGVTALIVWAIRSKRGDLVTRLDELELQNRQLLSRVVRLEGWTGDQESRPHSADVPAPTTAPELGVPKMIVSVGPIGVALGAIKEANEPPATHATQPQQASPDAHPQQALQQPDAHPQAQPAPPQQASPDAQPQQAQPDAPPQQASPDAHPQQAAQQPHAQHPQQAQPPAQQQPHAQQPPQQPPHDPPQPPHDPPQDPAPPFDWERLLGVRGAAALGGLALTAAAAYFFKYSLEVGLIGPAARVIIGTVLGVGLLVAAEGPLRKRYQVLGNWLAGAGGAVLYLSFWAATALYHLVPHTAGFVGMIAVTAVCCVLAVRRKAPAIAIMAFLGGFATPALLSTGSDRPIALFGYLLLLNGGLLLVARARGWSILPALSLGVSALYQLFWITARMGPGRLPLGIAIVMAFALVFALGSRPRAGEADTKLWRFSRFGAVFLPYLYSLYFITLSGDLGAHLWPVGLMLLVVSVGASWLAARDQTPWLTIAAAAGSLSVITAWSMSHTLTFALAWELVGVVAVLGVAFHMFAERVRRTGAEVTEVRFASALFTTASMFAMIAIAANAVAVGPWPFVALWVLGSLGIMRLVRVGGSPWLQIANAAAFAMGLIVVHGSRSLDAGFPAESVFAGVIVGGALLWQFAGMVGDAKVRRRGDQAAATFALLGLLSFAAIPNAVPLAPLVLFASVGLLALLAGLACARMVNSIWLGGAMVMTAFPITTHIAGGVATDALGLSAVAVSGAMIAFIFAPVLSKRLRERAGSWRVAALTPLVFFPALLMVHEEAFGTGSAGIPTLVLGGLGLLSALSTRSFGPKDPGIRKTAFVWPAVAALGFVTAAVPIQLENEWVTLTWAVQAVAVLMLWKRVDHPGLKYVSLALFSAVFIRLVFNPEVLGYHQPSGIPVFNWIAYAYLIPLACMLFGARILGELEVARRRSWETDVMGTRQLLQVGLVLAAITIGFVWINLTIVDAFSAGRSLELPFDRRPARDLTLSLAWALYGLLLLGLGIWKQKRGLRALGPGIIAITSLKVFLYDLGNLSDLWRVASLLGLAVSLILVSLVYQRFVFSEQSGANKQESS